MKGIFALGLVIGLGCGAGASRPQEVEASTSTLAPVGAERWSVRSSRARLDDASSRAIEAALSADVGFPTRVVARVDAGDEQLVLYAMNGASHWLARQPNRDVLAARLRACDDAEEEPRNCLDATLRDDREALLLRAAVAECMDRNVGSGMSEDECRQMEQESLVFDVEAYCDAGFWARARRRRVGAGGGAGGGGGAGAGAEWTVTDAGRLPQTCLAAVLDVRAVDLDGDGAEELLLDAVYRDMDAMELVTNAEVRTLSVWSWRGGDPAQLGDPLELGVYAADVSGLEERRCRYELVGNARVRLRRECCVEPSDDDGENEDGDGREEASAADRYPTWPPSPACGPRETVTLSPADGGGFRMER